MRNDRGHFMDLSGIFVFFLLSLCRFRKQSSKMELVLLTCSSGRKMTRIARSSARKWTSLLVVLEGKWPRLLIVYPQMAVQNVRTCVPSASQNDEASTGLVPSLKLTKMWVRTFWTAPNFVVVFSITNTTLVNFSLIYIYINHNSGYIFKSVTQIQPCMT